MGTAIRIEDDGAVRHLVLCRPDEFNTITVGLRDELGAALDAADADNDVRVVLIRAEGKAFCAGFGLDWSTVSQAGEDGARGRVWDTVADVRMIGTFGNTFAKLHSISKPTLAAVQGWCIAGGTDMILNADLIVASESARFGYPPARVWGVPEAPWVWVARLGLERAKRYLFTGDELTATEAAAAGMILECVPDDELLDHATALARRMATPPAEPAPDDEVDAQRRGAPPVPARHEPAARVHLRRRRPAHPGRARLRRARARRSAGATPCASATDRSATTASAADPVSGRHAGGESQIIIPRPAISSTPPSDGSRVAQVQALLRFERSRGEDQAAHARRVEERDLGEIDDDGNTRGAGARDGVGERVVGGVATGEVDVAGQPDDHRVHPCPDPLVSRVEPTGREDLLGEVADRDPTRPGGAPQRVERAHGVDALGGHQHARRPARSPPDAPAPRPSWSTIVCRWRARMAVPSSSSTTWA